MDIKVLCIDNYLENGTITDEQYKEKEEYIKRLKKVATKDRNMYSTKDEISSRSAFSNIILRLLQIPICLWIHYNTKAW